MIMSFNIISKELRVKKKRKKLIQEQYSKDKDNNKHRSARSNDLDQKIKSEDKNLDLLLHEIKTDRDDCNATELNELEENQDEVESKVWQKGKSGFSWNKYLEHTKSKAAPAKLFKDAFPYSKNNFKIGMKLEGIDPNHPSRYCVLTVVEIIGE